jgi:hypothetical protein
MSRSKEYFPKRRTLKPLVGVRNTGFRVLNPEIGVLSLKVRVQNGKLGNSLWSVEALSDER